jgi:Tfp pilus assembly protein PilF
MQRAGRSARLTQQPLRVLIELFDHAGEIVGRDQLVKALWPQGIVDFDNGLNVAVRKLRVALEDTGDAPRYIETLPRVGYRFIGVPGPPPPETPARTAKGMSRRSRLLLAVVACIFAVCIAVAFWRAAHPAAATAHHVPSERARELYLAGLSQRSRRDINAAPLAIANLEAALREDPNYPEAWAVYADVISAAVIRQDLTPALGVPKALSAARRAIELDPDLPQAHFSLGEIYLDHKRDFAASLAELERARELNDQLGRLWHHYAMWHGHQGHIEKALTYIRRAREFEPMTLLYSVQYGLLLYNARRYDEAVAFLQPLVAANPNFDQARSILARSMIATGNLPGAQEQLRLRRMPGMNQSEDGFLAAKLGRREDALREVARLEDRGRAGFGVAYDIAVIQAALGDLDAGCAALARAVDDHSVLLGWMRLDPRMDALRGRQCFATVEKKVYGD